VLLALTLQINQNHGLLNFALLRTLNSIASAKLLMPPPTHTATKFCLLSPEAYLLTWELNN
jgi:hypothetical protein